MVFRIESKLDGLNEYTAECRGNKFGGGKCKKKNEQIILAYIAKAKLKKIQKPFYINFEWYEDTKRRDKDNVAFAKKFILDALQKANIIPDDNNNYLLGFKDSFVYGKGQGVIVEITEVEVWHTTWLLQRINTNYL